MIGSSFITKLIGLEFKFATLLKMLRKKNTSFGIVKNPQTNVEYVLEFPISEGPFIDVFRGYSVTDKTQYLAIKRIDGALVEKLEEKNKKSVLASLLVQGKIVKLKHPNILFAEDSFAIDKFTYVVSKFSKFGTLKDLIRKWHSRKPVGVEEPRRVFKQIMIALAFLRRSGFIVRNLSPENILLMESGRVVLSGFSFSKESTLTQGVIKEIKDEATILPKSPFIAPEVAKAESFNDKADVWSFGVVLYEMFYCKNPFAGELLVKGGVLDSIKQISGANLAFNAEFNGQVPNEAKELLKKMLAFDKNERPSFNEIMTSEFFKKQFGKEDDLVWISETISTSNERVLKAKSPEMKDIPQKESYGKDENAFNAKSRIDFRYWTINRLVRMSEMKKVFLNIGAVLGELGLPLKLEKIQFRLIEFLILTLRKAEIAVKEFTDGIENKKGRLAQFEGFKEALEDEDNKEELVEKSKSLGWWVENFQKALEIIGNDFKDLKFEEKSVTGIKDQVQRVEKLEDLKRLSKDLEEDEDLGLFLSEYDEGKEDNQRLWSDFVYCLMTFDLYFNSDFEKDLLWLL